MSLHECKFAKFINRSGAKLHNPVESFAKFARDLHIPSFFWSSTTPAEFPIKLHSLRCQSRSIFLHTYGVVLHTATRLIHVPWFFFSVHFSFRGPKLVPGWFTVGWPGWFVLFAWKKFYKPNAGKKKGPHANQVAIFITFLWFREQVRAERVSFC